MPGRDMPFRNLRLSLRDLLGEEYIEAVCAARAFVARQDLQSLKAIADEKVDFYPEAFHARLLELLPKTGQPIARPMHASAAGASTKAFDAATRQAMAPLTGYGYFRVGQDGRLYLISKSEHYHAPLGHGFPGYRLVELAGRLGIPNATHNNTRGQITRRLEEELIRTANGIAPADREQLKQTIESSRPAVLNRVLNLETGSLALEAALKMILSKFYKSQPDVPAPPYAGKVPVVVVIGGDAGSLNANYHGTTMFAQMLRGMWPEMLTRLEEQGLLLVRAVRPNRIEDVEQVFRTYDAGRYKIAAFCHEIVMMNYGGRLLAKDFLQQIYAMCEQRDVATVVDEIQSCIWHPHLYMFREYELKPTFVVVGKGFAGGQYAASRVLFSAGYDNLPQFGALVTNGQEELASLVYLITMKWAESNADITRQIGDYYEQRLKELAAKHANLIRGIEGKRHLGAIWFRQVEPAKAFAEALTAEGIDISVQTYKAACPPAALTKLPLTAGYEFVDLLVEKMDSALQAIAGS